MDSDTVLKPLDQLEEVREFPLGRFEIGRAVVAYEDGRVLDLLPGQAFRISSVPHDS